MRVRTHQLILWMFAPPCRFKVGAKEPGKYRAVLDSDAVEFGGHGRVRHMAG